MRCKRITEKERYIIETLLKEKQSIPLIAKKLNRSTAGIYKEFKRGSVSLLCSDLTYKSVYLADYAQLMYEKSVSNCGAHLKYADNMKLLDRIARLIRKYKLSPYCVSIILKNDGINISEGTIYNYIKFKRIAGVSQADLHYRKKKQKKRKVKRFAYKNALKQSIDDRPAAASDRKDFGHWEIDTVYSGKNTSKACLLVLTERMTRAEIIVKMKDRSADSVNSALVSIQKKCGTLKYRKIFKTITADNGSEFIRNDFYYCHPYCSGERGSNENNNKLIRYFIPKGTNINAFTRDDIKDIENYINNLPRKIFNGKSAADMLNMENVVLF